MRPWFALLMGGLVALTGCAGAAVRSQSPEDALLPASSTRLIGQIAVAHGMYPVKITAVGLVTGLAGTGSDPDPSPQRAMLVGEMQVRGVKNADSVLASPNNSLVLVRGYLRPGIQKGDHFDIEVYTPSPSGTTSLRNGWLMPARLKEHAIFGNQLREGELLGFAQGAVMVDPAADSEDRVALGRGWILGGGVALKSRGLGLVLKPDFQKVHYAAQVQTAVNKRFHTFQRGIKQGVANALNDEYIELAVHRRYRDNVPRYMQVVRSLPLKETPAEQSARLALLERQLVDPLTASSAAMRLEAIGRDAVAALKKGTESKDPEVRFYAAEALAYLDDAAAAAPLAAAAHDEPAFRVFAFTALSAMDDVAAYDALEALLHVASAETRYGAFRALWAMNSQDRLVRGEQLGGQFSYHVVDSPGPEMIHVTRSYRPEIVLFGNEQRLRPPFALEAGKHIMVNALDGQEVTLSKFSLHEPTQKRVVSTRVDEVIRAIVDLGGTYPDVVQALQQAKAKGALASRFEVDALPKADRKYYRREAMPGEPDAPPEDDEELGFVVGHPQPELFGREGAGGTARGGEAEKEAENSKSQRSLLGRIMGRPR